MVSPVCVVGGVGSAQFCGSFFCPVFESDAFDTKWQCRQCQFARAHASGTKSSKPLAPPQCAVCPMPGGALKPADDGVRWVHVYCALWISELSFVDSSRMEPIAGIDLALSSRKHLTCELCKRKGGACIQCHEPKWYVHLSRFHVRPPLLLLIGVAVLM